MVSAGLISVMSRPGCNPIVTLLDATGREHEDGVMTLTGKPGQGLVRNLCP
jgi:hypothetical protein